MPKPPPAPAPPLATLVLQWYAAKAELTSAKARELALREKVMAAAFKTPDTAKEGTHSVGLPGVGGLYLTRRTEYETSDDMILFDRVLGQLPPPIAIPGRLFHWSARLDVKCYKAQPPDWKKIADQVITSKLASPVLEFEPLKK